MADRVWVVIDRRGCVVYEDIHDRCHSEVDTWTAYTGDTYDLERVLWHKTVRKERAVLIDKKCAVGMSPRRT